jgi:ribosome-associated heat shock protein Hsp15
VADERETADKVRIDKWLWAARFFKTRSLATDAVNGGKVEVNDAGVKPAKLVQAGDTVSVRVGPQEHQVVVRAVADRRGSAAVAQTLYEETAESRARRERVSEQMRLASAGFVYEDKGRPTKRDRRDLERFRDGRRG